MTPLATVDQTYPPFYVIAAINVAITGGSVTTVAVCNMMGRVCSLKDRSFGCNEPRLLSLGRGSTSIHIGLNRYILYVFRGSVFVIIDKDSDTLA